MIISRPSSPSSGPPARAEAAASAIASGRRRADLDGTRRRESVATPLMRPTRRPTSSASTSAVVGIAVGALQPGGDDGARRVGEAQDRGRSGQPAAARGKRAAEPVAGAEPVDHLDRDRRHLDPLVARRGRARPPAPA